MFKFIVKHVLINIMMFLSTFMLLLLYQRKWKLHFLFL